MDFSATLSAINLLSIDERIRLVEAVWDSIATEQPIPPVTESQKNELDRRLAAYRVAPDDVILWETVKEQALARGRKQ
jgi:putative addiction module component (TIGR02574 family)